MYFWETRLINEECIGSIGWGHDVREMNRKEMLKWLREENPEQLESLWQEADRVRREGVGDEVHLRGLIEFSNHCARHCAYCGIRADNLEVSRYRMSEDEIMACVRQAMRFEYGTVVLQAGEDYGYTAEWLAALVRRIKSETPLAVTLSLGERSDEDLELWREAGADRYLLRFETSNREIYERIHPPLPGRISDRIEMLRQLKRLGYETGSGVMIGIPGQTYDDLASDLRMFAELDLDMVGVGPYIPHPLTPLGRDGKQWRAPEGEQVPSTEAMTYKVVALTRLVRPLANIPSTTALATLNLEQGRELGLMRGANVVMPNLTPARYRELYEIYPNKACLSETADQCHSCMKMRILSIDRKIGKGRGDSRNRMVAA